MDSRHEFTHDWANQAVMNIESIVDCLMSQAKGYDQMDFLRHFVGNVLDNFATLRDEEDRFDFNYFSHAIDKPVCVFDNEVDAPASYHDVAKNLVNSLVFAEFPEDDLPRISKQDAQSFDVADFDRVARELENVTGHKLRAIKKRLVRLNGGLAKEGTRLGSRTPETFAKPQTPERTADSKTDDNGEWSLPATMNIWTKRLEHCDKTLRNWRKAGTLRMKKLAGQRGMWRVHTKDQRYIEWDRSRTSLKD